jgi:hypothetical protein
MQDMIAKGAAWFDAQRKEHMSVWVEYRPLGTMFSRRVRATVGMMRWDAIDAAGQMIRFDTRDYLVSIDDYQAEPKRGDRIVEVDESGTRRSFEVMIPGGQNNPWSWADRGQRVRRIHTQLVETD